MGVPPQAPAAQSAPKMVATAKHANPEGMFLYVIVQDHCGGQAPPPPGHGISGACTRLATPIMAAITNAP